MRTLGVVPFFMIISSSGKEKWLPFDDQSGAHEHDHKQEDILEAKNSQEVSRRSP